MYMYICIYVNVCINDIYVYIHILYICTWTVWIWNFHSPAVYMFGFDRAFGLREVIVSQKQQYLLSKKIEREDQKEPKLQVPIHMCSSPTCGTVRFEKRFHTHEMGLLNR